MSKNVYLANRYKLIIEIGSGSFGKVYETKDKINGGSYAAKIEERKDNSRLKDEYEIYKKLKKNGITTGIPNVVDFFTTPKQNILIMQLLGSSLDGLLEQNGGFFDMGTVLKLGIDMVKLLKNIHNAGFIHRDIKPNNFLVGNENGEDLYIMDFGLSKQYVSERKHIGLKVERSLVGTARYASINVHMGFEPSRRDDLESVGYMLVYFIKGHLPWQGLKKKKGVDQIKLIGDTKTCTHLNKLCYNLPTCFHQYLKYCRNLSFTEKPNYEFLQNLFIEEANKSKIEMKYCWLHSVSDSASSQ